MNTTLEPREVDRPFAQRWLRATFALFLRSPFRFGVLIALLGCLDTSAVNFANGYIVQKVWVDRLGIVALPFLWVLVSAVARGADDNSLTWQTLLHLGRRSVWIGAFSVGVGMAALSWFFHSLFHGFGTVAAQNPPAYLQHQGDFLASIEASVVLIAGSVGITYCPLLALVPGLSAPHASSLSRKADKINGLVTILTMTTVLAIGAIYLTSAIPAYGMSTAAFLVFFGVLNYVAYRDIFERRSENLPRQIVTAQVAATVEVGRSQEVRRDGRRLMISLSAVLKPRS
jgi:hypothetical protein